MRNNEINFICMGQALTLAISQLSWVQRKQAFLIVPTFSAFPQMRRPLFWLMPRPRPTTSSQKAQTRRFRWDPLVTIPCRNAITELIPEFTLNFSHLQLTLFGCWGWAELCWSDEQIAREAWLLLATVSRKESLCQSSWLSLTSLGCVGNPADSSLFYIPPHDLGSKCTELSPSEISQSEAPLLVLCMVFFLS